MLCCKARATSARGSQSRPVFPLQPSLAWHPTSPRLSLWSAQPGRRAARSSSRRRRRFSKSLAFRERNLLPVRLNFSSSILLKGSLIPLTGGTLRAVFKTCVWPGRIYDFSADHGEQRFDAADFGHWYRHVILRQNSEVGKFSRLE